MVDTGVAAPPLCVGFEEREDLEVEVGRMEEPLETDVLGEEHFGWPSASRKQVSPAAFVWFGASSTSMEVEWRFENVLTTAKVLAGTSLLALDRAFVG